MFCVPCIVKLVHFYGICVCAYESGCVGVYESIRCNEFKAICTLLSFLLLHK